MHAVLHKQFSSVSWHVVHTAFLVYVATCWVGMFLCGEEHLLSLDRFIYWIIVTTSTVGYGDLGPQSTAGRWFVSLFVIPGGLTLFAAILGRAIAFSGHHWQKGIKGLKDLNLSGHIVVVGWNGQRTLHLLDLLLSEESASIHPRKIVLCATDAIENPKIGVIEFVNVEKYNSIGAMKRASIDTAECIIIDTHLDLDF